MAAAGGCDTMGVSRGRCHGGLGDLGNATPSRGLLAGGGAWWEVDVVLRGSGVPGRVPVALGVGRWVMARVGAGVAMRAETTWRLVVGGHLHRINAPGGVVSCE